jgi:hypothetical protein
VYYRFVIVKFKMDHLLQQPNRRAVLDLLAKLDEPLAGEQLLDKTYGRILQNINRQEDIKRELAFVTLTWLMHARRTLSVSEISTAISIESRNYEIDPDGGYDATTLLDVCQGFVVVDDESQLVRLAHSTVREYLSRTVPVVKNGTNIPILCLTYLSYTYFSTGFCFTQAEFNERLATYPFLGYAGRYLELHIHENSAGDTQQLIEAIQYLVNHDGNLQTYIQISQAPVSQDYGFDWYTKRTGQLHVLASIGLYLYEGLTTDAYSQINALEQTPLHIASMKGRLAAVNFLVEKGVDPCAKDNRGYTSLCWAVREGNIAVVEAFLKLDGQTQSILSQRTNLGETPLHIAVSKQHLNIAECLIKGGMKVDLIDMEDNTALHVAAQKGLCPLIRLLLKSGAVTNPQNKRGLTACDEARLAGFDEAVELFREFSVFPTLKDFRGNLRKFRYRDICTRFAK